MAQPNNQIPSEQPDLDHATVQTLLPEYVALASEGRDPEPVFPAVAAHLAACGDCYAAFVELLELTAIAESDLPPDLVPVSDLAFSRQTLPQQSLIPSLTRSSLGEVLVAFSRPMVEAFLQPKLAGAFRGALLHRASQPIPGAAPGSVTVEIRGEADTRCELTVRLRLPGRPPLEQGGALVRLRAGALALEATSDDDGVVSFPGLPREALPLVRLTITSV